MLKSFSPVECSADESGDLGGDHILNGFAMLEWPFKYGGNKTQNGNIEAAAAAAAAIEGFDVPLNVDEIDEDDIAAAAAALAKNWLNISKSEDLCTNWSLIDNWCARCSFLMRLSTEKYSFFHVSISVYNMNDADDTDADWRTSWWTNTSETFRTYDPNSNRGGAFGINLLVYEVRRLLKVLSQEKISFQKVIKPI